MGRAVGTDERVERRRPRRPVIAVDVDGVLGDTHSAICPIVFDLHGVQLSPDDIVVYDFDVADGVKIGPIIWKAFDDEEFVGSMPVHTGATEMLTELAQLGQVLIVTARPPHTTDWTHSWLSAHSLVFDELLISTEGGKSSCGADILVDDYLGNVIEFLENTTGSAILLDRPWNRDREVLAEALASGRTQVAASLEAVPSLARQLLPSLS